MRIRNYLVAENVVSNDDIDFLAETTPEVVGNLEQEATDANIITFIELIQDLSVSMLGDGNTVTDTTQRYDDIVFKVSAI